MKYLLLMTLMFSGAVYSAPENPAERQQFTSSLNSMASKVMSWYGCLLAKKEHCSQITKLSLLKQHQKLYPQNITQIKIMGTDLKPSDNTKNNYIFSIKIHLEQQNSKTKNTLSMTDDFLFELNNLNEFMIENVRHEKPKSIDNFKDKQFTKSYFDHREIAYQWLAYLDNAPLSETLKKQVERVDYSIEMGNKHWHDLARNIIFKRNQYLAKGGHLLRNIKVRTNTSSCVRSIDLTIEWKGENKEKLPVIANIKQHIQYKILKNGHWVILSVDEKHVLPSHQSWIGLLC